MKWQIVHAEYPHGDMERMVCVSIEEVWDVLNGFKIEKKFPDCFLDEKIINEMEHCWRGDDPVLWMNFYNENVKIPGEHISVLDLETLEVLLQ